MKAIITLLILIAAVNTVNAYVANIYRVDENGSIITGPVSYDIPDYDWSPRNSKVAEVGYVYVHNANYLCCFDEELNLISTRTGGVGSGRFSIDDVRSELVILTGAGGIVWLDLTLGFLKQPVIDGDPLDLSIDETDGSVWYTGTAYDSSLYKCDHDGNPIYEFTEAYDDFLSDVSPEGKFWTLNYSRVRLRNSRGWVLAECESSYFHDAYICEMFFGDDSCWVLNRLGDDSLTKINSSGEIVYHNSTDFNRPFRLAVNQNDGSVWVTDQYNYDLVHLDSNGIELLRKDWDYNLLLVAVDPSDGTVIVVDTPRDTEITPSSFGCIKALFR